MRSALSGAFKLAISHLRRTSVVSFDPPVAAGREPRLVEEANIEAAQAARNSALTIANRIYQEGDPQRAGL
jgi:hypothetical protein